MNHYLIVYRRSEGKLLRCTEYRSQRSGELALMDRFTLERHLADLAAALQSVETT